MNALKIFFIVVLFCGGLTNAQNNNWIIGAGSNYNLPLAGMADRMEGAFGGFLYAGKQTSESWKWFGKIEYFKLSDVNKEMMFKVVQADINDVTGNYRFELPLLEMELTSAGLSVEAKYNLFRSDFFEADLNFGFGFYYWEYSRSGYKDSLFVDSTGNGDLLLVEFLNVPPLFQKDWSGGINIGTDINILLFDPMAFSFGFNYKLIIGELWPALSLNLENVSGMQFIDLRAGLRIIL